MKKKICGILGGMGPEATVDLMNRVIKSTPAADDIDHVRMVVDNNPQVPSRIKALYEKTGEDPSPCLQEMARKLASFGVDFLAMPCNTAHFYHQAIQNAVQIPVLDMIGLSVQAIMAEAPYIEKTGILASPVVIDLGLYEKQFAARGVELITPDDAFQEQVMEAIRLIKTSRYDAEVVKILQSAADNLVHKQAEVILIACTELSIVANALHIPVKCVDAIQILAEAIIHKAQAHTYPPETA